MITLRLTDEEAGLVRAAWAWKVANGHLTTHDETAQQQREPRSMNEWLVGVVTAAAKAEQERHGVTLSPVPPGRLPAGRPPAA